MDIVLVQLEYFLRLALAALLGGVIGIERELRGKEAGIRTHVVVSLAACVMMLVSKYGFNDVLALNGIGLDPSRVAAGIVSGVGFLGAGIIFTRGRAINGLTTAAGVWATVGVGMAMGAGMYAVSAASALLVLILQALLHRDLSFLRSKGVDLVCIRVEDRAHVLIQLSQALERCGIEPLSIKAERGGDGTLSVVVEQEQKPGRSLAEQYSDLMEADFVRSVEW